MADTAVGQLVSTLSRLRPGLVVDTSALTVSQYSYDASNYRVAPAAVVFPRDADDVGVVLRAAAAAGLPVTARGSGTSMAGNAIGPGVVLDFSKHLKRIRRIDPVGRTATVEAGVLLDTLQAAAAEHGLMFGPDPSSHSRVSFGGMVGNDACGNHSVAYGRTSDHVLELEALLADGTSIIAGPHGLRALHTEDADRVAALENELRSLIGLYLGPLRLELDRVPRQVSGYHLHRLLPEHGFDVARALVGSEGSLVIVTAMTVALVSRPRATVMVVAGYADLIDAARDVPAIIEHAPTAIEAMDSAIVAAMRRRSGAARADLPDGSAWLYLELSPAEEASGRTDNDDLQRRVQALITTLTGGGSVRDIRVVWDAAERSRLWRIREDGAGLAANLPGAARAWPGWEDAAVAPHRLAEYLVGFRALLAEHGYTGVLYGHFGAGCVHVRIDLDTGSEVGRRRMHDFVQAAAHLVARLGGTLSGEHGDGRARSALLPILYSADVLRAFGQVKQLFDRANLLNPGIIVRPADLIDDLVPTLLLQPRRTGLALSADHGSLAEAAGRCVGIGRCVAPTGGVMCPSHRATGAERDATRGRARALQDYLSGSRPITGEDVLQTLDLCLSCKACSTDCPTGVDMASYKSEFLYQHYRGKLRPWTHYSLGWLPTLAALAAPVAPLVNAMTRRRSVRRLLPALAGVTAERAVPRFARPNVRRHALATVPSQGETLLFVDTFTRAFRPELVRSATRVLADAGISVQLAPRGCCGLTWITTGQLDRARRVLHKTVARLSGAGFDGKPIIALEPSCAATLAGDAAELVSTESAEQLEARVLTFEQALRTLAKPGWRPPPLPSAGVLQAHCHERSTFPASRPGSMLRQAGMTELDEAIGCCGLAGNFGFEADHYETSMAVAETALAPALRRAAADAVFVADGFGCQVQIAQLQPKRPARHLAEVLDDALTRTKSSAVPTMKEALS
ncbi:FAD-binding and (Fe-S)-binding domain-containing protein [Jatrophihabitans lederbergiae]|uniref:FAD-binding and (Fe-S)-binding domain-containing protein n=1 Tax=Jatrophihabitans lederbergiae TaxID=3075547 RepID=A0ABU2JGZ6_9ACTN|nr:FAD-binding and (Fe-S)-binding domain-containing protein [Jatrophihabitans sp. DSM 44399]MDT0263998.1 FAD-binding and (Fe-S)-binding domain-containing protein [Jatrophihabitans sp. DSM 44399]